MESSLYMWFPMTAGAWSLRSAGHRGCAQVNFKKRKPYFPQHFLYFLPLPQGQGSLRPTFFSEIIVFVGFSNISRLVISSGLSGSNSILYFQPFSIKTGSNSFTLSSVCTFMTAGFLSVPNFDSFIPSNFFSICSPLRYLQIHLSHNVARNRCKRSAAEFASELICCVGRIFI
jgi:hypothetical protein